jgi:hypothetical protein
MEDSVRPLPLDNPRWGELGTRMGRREGEDVRSALRVLTANPSQTSVFGRDVADDLLGREDL